MNTKQKKHNKPPNENPEQKPKPTQKQRPEQKPKHTKYRLIKTHTETTDKPNLVDSIVVFI